MKPIKLDQEQKEQILSILNPDNQPFRLLAYLADHPRSPTGTVRLATSIGNISAIAKHLNPNILRFGYRVGCLKPPVCYVSRFKYTLEREWSVCELSPAEVALLPDEEPMVIDSTWYWRRHEIEQGLQRKENRNSLLKETREIAARL